MMTKISVSSSETHVAGDPVSTPKEKPWFSHHARPSHPRGLRRQGFVQLVAPRDEQKEMVIAGGLTFALVKESCAFWLHEATLLF